MDTGDCYDSLKWLIFSMSLAMWYVVIPFSYVLEPVCFIADFTCSLQVIFHEIHH